jgi:cytochrome c biogenesis protein CcmG, thiol:disulfide interchange protein DsbE
MGCAFVTERRSQATIRDSAGMARFRPSTFQITVVVVAVLAFAQGAHAALSPRDLLASARDSTRAAATLGRVDSLRATPLDPNTRKALLAVRLYALLSLHAPADEITVWADSAILAGQANPFGLPELYRSTAVELIGRHQRLDRARSYVEAGVTLSTREPQLAELRGMFLEYRARAQLATDARDSALVTIIHALEATREDSFSRRHTLYLLLAWAHDQAGQTSDAIDAHVRLAGAAFEPDTSHMNDLRRLWLSRHGSLAGLGEELASERAASRQRLAFEAPRVDRSLPTLELPTLHGSRWATDSLSGHVAVVDFWGRWCEPCLGSLPKLQELYARLSPRGVRFIAVDVEFQPKDLATHRTATAAFMKENGYTFPVVLDLQGAATEPLNIPAFPTTWVVDPRGRVRFENAGVFVGSDTILVEQIESLLGPRQARSPRR